MTTGLAQISQAKNLLKRMRTDAMASSSTPQLNERLEAIISKTEADLQSDEMFKAAMTEGKSL
eukprot:3794619-Pyramimonas_sp.AAC.1